MSSDTATTHLVFNAEDSDGDELPLLAFRSLLVCLCSDGIAKFVVSDPKRWACPSTRRPKNCGGTVSAAVVHDGAPNARGPDSGRIGCGAWNAVSAPTESTPFRRSAPPRPPRGISGRECREYLEASLSNGGGVDGDEGEAYGPSQANGNEIWRVWESALWTSVGHPSVLLWRLLLLPWSSSSPCRCSV
jgi:hypothetical protein